MEHSIPQPGTFPGLYAHLEELTRDLAPNEALAFEDKKANLRITRNDVPILHIDTHIDGKPVVLVWDGDRGRGLYLPDENGQHQGITTSENQRAELQLLAWSGDGEQPIHIEGLHGVARKQMASRVKLEIAEPNASHTWTWDEESQDPRPAASVSMSGSTSIMAAAKQLGNDHYLVCVNLSYGTTLYTFRIPG